MGFLIGRAIDEINGGHMRWEGDGLAVNQPPIICSRHDRARLRGSYRRRRYGSCLGDDSGVCPQGQPSTSQGRNRFCCIHDDDGSVRHVSRHRGSRLAHQCVHRHLCVVPRGNRMDDRAPPGRRVRILRKSRPVRRFRPLCAFCRFVVSVGSWIASLFPTPCRSRVRFSSRSIAELPFREQVNAMLPVLDRVLEDTARVSQSRCCEHPGCAVSSQ